MCPRGQTHNSLMKSRKCKHFRGRCHFSPCMPLKNDRFKVLYCTIFSSISTHNCLSILWEPAACGRLLLSLLCPAKGSFYLFFIRSAPVSYAWGLPWTWGYALEHASVMNIHAVTLFRFCESAGRQAPFMAGLYKHIGNVFISYDCRMAEKANEGVIKCVRIYRT